MKTSVLLAWLTISTLINTNAQPSFSKNYHFTYNDSGWNVFAMDDGYLLLSLAICDPSIACTTLIKTDFEGNKAWQVHIDSLRVANGYNLTFDSTAIYLAMYSSADTSAERIQLLKFDQKGNLLKYKRFGHGFYKAYPMSLNWYDHQILLAIDDRRNDTTTSYMQYLSTEFDSIRAIRLIKNYGGNSKAFHQIPGNKFLHTRTFNEFIERKAGIMKIDANGNLLWKHSTEAAEGTYFDLNSALCPDGGIAAHWNKEVPVWSEDTLDIADYVFKLDSNGQELWRYYFYKRYERHISDLFTAKNGDLIGCGTFFYYEKPNEPDSSFYGSWIFCLDQSGQLKWEREIVDKRYPSGQELLAGTQDKNGDLIFTGSIGFLGPPEGLNTWLLKLDSSGCLISGCGDVVTFLPIENLQPEVSGITLAPNPARDDVAITFPDQYASGYLHLQDGRGLPLKTFPLNQSGVLEISLGNIPAGWYILSISKEGRPLLHGRLAVIK